METIGKFRTNFLGKGKSFKVGFNNRSPFSYISSTGPEVPSRYDGGVPLVNFTPDQYAKAYDSSDAVRAEHEMHKAKGQAIGQTAAAVGNAVAGAIDAGKPGSSFKDIMKGAKDGFKAKGKDAMFDSSTPSGDDGMTDIRRKTTSSSSSGGDNNYYSMMPGNSNRTDTNSGWNPFSGLAEDYDKIYS
jgi:hypothetical protein